MNAAALATVCATSMFIVSCGMGSHTVEATGPLVVEPRAIASSKAIEINAPVTVTINIDPAAAPALSLSAPQDAMSQLITRVGSDGTLFISVAEGVNLRSNKPMTATITLPEMQSIVLTGSEDATVTGVADANKFEASNTGSGNIRLEAVRSKRLTTKLSGSGNIDIRSGKADDMKADISGAGSFGAAGVEAEDASVTISGSGNAVVNVSDDLNASISGSGNISYNNEHHPKVVQQISGSGSIMPVR